MISHRNRTAQTHQFAMVPRADIPRAKFNINHTHKSTFDSGTLVPIFCEEVLPGDTWRLRMTAFARMATPLFPIMDNLRLTSFFFYVPNRLLWTNWQRFMGEQDTPGDSISFIIPTIALTVAAATPGSLYDHFGIPIAGQLTTTMSINALPFRAYNQIYNQWFRDENISPAQPKNVGDGPDNPLNYGMMSRSKRPDYFTTALPWPQKGGTPVSIPLGTSAPIRVSGSEQYTGVSPGIQWRDGTTPGTVLPAGRAFMTGAAVAGAQGMTVATAAGGLVSGATLPYPTNLYADLSVATAATINQLRQSFQIQKLLERDARGGTRYTELIRAHFGVMSPDARLQRPEYLGGGTAPIIINPIAQTSGTNITGQDAPLATLSAAATALAHGHGFTQSFTEHGYIIGLVSVQADLTYQQGLRRMWTRSTKFDFYWPAFAMLGEQSVLQKEIFCDGTANDAIVFGYQERWAEYRYIPNQITGLFRSTSAGTIDVWHLAQRFITAPTLNYAFITDQPPLSRALAVGTDANGQQFLFDAFFDIQATRPLPLYSVPGLIDHF